MNRLRAAHEERFVVFDCEGSPCVGIVSEPAPMAASSIGVVIVVGGPQYRVGSHRQFVLLARSLAEAGLPTLRFDYRGMGDSEGEPRTFENIDADIRASVDTLCRETGIERVVLWGLCDGASAAFMYARGDPRVAGIVALNPWARSSRGEASTRLRHYYFKRLVSADFWKSVVTRRFRAGASANDLAVTLRKAVRRDAAPVTFIERMEAGLQSFSGSTLFVLSGRDLTAREFEAWVGAIPRRKVLLDDPRNRVFALPQADHTFSDHASRDAVATATLEWITRIDTAR